MLGASRHQRDGRWSLTGVVNVGLIALVIVETIIVSHYRGKYFSLLSVRQDVHLDQEADQRLTSSQQAQQAQSKSLGRAGAISSQPHEDSRSPPFPTISKLQQQMKSDGKDLQMFSLMHNETYRKRNQELMKGPNGEALRSNKWAPLRVSVCLEGMPRHWAPCLNPPGLDIAYAEEVVYPAHKVRLPGFLRDEDRDRWVKVIQSRGLTVKEDHKFVGFHVSGQNFVLRNVRYTNNPFPDNWVADDTHCLGWNGEIGQLKATPQPGPSDKVHDELFLANTPQAFSFQHFSDHVFKLVMQGMHLLTPRTDVLTSDTGYKTVREIWTWFQPINTSRIIYGKAPGHYARSLIHSCRCPFWHPYMLQRWTEMALGPASPQVPMAERKVVLYYSRSIADKRRHNGGRRVLNEEDLIKGIRGQLERRGQNETLRVFNLDDFKTYKELAVFINRHVRAFVGPHGGGLMNLMWGARDTLVVEFQHHHHVNYAMWELAPLLEHNYWVLMYPPQGATDMTVNVPEVVQLLDEQLGKVLPPNHVLHYDYDWPKALANY